MERDGNTPGLIRGFTSAGRLNKARSVLGAPGLDGPRMGRPLVPVARLDRAVGTGNRLALDRRIFGRHCK